MKVNLSENRRSKIICTLGPATSDYQSIFDLVKNGMDVARLNFSHGDHESHAQNILNIRKASKEASRTVAILGDLQGPKIRIGPLLNKDSTKSTEIALHEGQKLYFRGAVNTRSSQAGSGTKDSPINISYPKLTKDLKEGETLLIDDGMVFLKVSASDEKKNLLEAVVVQGKKIGERKGVNMPLSKLSASGITEKDWKDILFAIENDVDLLALSFVRSYRELKSLQQYLKQKNLKIGVIAKIEKQEAIDDLENILNYSQGIMVARGDLGVEIGNDKVPIIQKRIIELCRQKAVPVITATQMLLSMVENPFPTRAEASDVANAVLDGTDALMLSNETAVGKNPTQVVKTMTQIILEAESLGARNYWHQQKSEENIKHSETEDLAQAACQLAEATEAQCLSCLTKSGSSARLLSKFRPSMPIYAFSEEAKVCALLCLSWGVYVIPWKESKHTDSELFHSLVDALAARNFISNNQRAVMVAGIPTSMTAGTSNTITIQKYPVKS